MRVLLCLTFVLVAKAAPVEKEAEVAVDSRIVLPPFPHPPRPDDDPTSSTTEGPKFELEGAQTADLAFLVDVTGSMSSYIEGVKEAIEKIVQNANRKEIALRLAFIGYRDPFGDGKVPQITEEVEKNEFEILPFTKKLREFKDFMVSVRASGGGDGPEDVFGGLEKAGQLAWDPLADRRILFHIADQTAHGSQFGGSGHFNGGDPLERSLAALLGSLKDAKVEFKFGKVSGTTDKMIGAFSEVWGEDIPQFTVAAPRRSFGHFGGPMPMLARRGPPGAPGPMGAAGRGAPSASFAFMGAGAAGAEAEASVSDKLVGIFDEILD